MRAGIDFGTSNSACAVIDCDKISLTSFGDSLTQLPSVLYTDRSTIVIPEIDEAELEARVKKTWKNQETRLRKERKDAEKHIAENLFRLKGDLRTMVARGEKLEDSQTVSDIVLKEKRKYFVELEKRLKKNTVSRENLTSIERGVMHREILFTTQRAYESQPLADALESGEETYFGKEAIYRHLSDPLTGFFVKSPKTFLGSDISNQHLKVFSEVISRILGYIKKKAESQANKEIEDVVLGRPVNFQGGKGNEQALNVLRTATIEAGFKNVEFQYEPVAAALDFETSMNQDAVVLVVDIGGGTTDCTMIKLGPSYRNDFDREESILSCCGKRIGGIDLDIRLAMATMMPSFGKGETQLSNSIYWDAISINDVNAQSRFYSVATKMEIQKHSPNNLINRFLAIHEQRLSYRINRSAELAKIALSEKSDLIVPMGYIEEGFSIPISVDSYEEAIAQQLSEFSLLVEETVKMAGVNPEFIFVTGGSALSPIVRASILSKFQDIDIVLGNSFETVVSGLARWANVVFD